jgi:hypothetical protein
MKSVPRSSAADGNPDESRYGRFKFQETMSVIEQLSAFDEKFPGLAEHAEPEKGGGGRRESLCSATVENVYIPYPDVVHIDASPRVDFGFGRNAKFERLRFDSPREEILLFQKKKEGPSPDDKDKKIGGYFEGAGRSHGGGLYPMFFQTIP